MCPSFEKPNTQASNQETQPEPPIKEGEVFDPKAELEKVRQTPKEERREKLDAYKEKIAYQKEGLADIQTELTDFIREKPDTSFTELEQKAKELGAKYGITSLTKIEIYSMLSKFANKHEKISEIRKKYPDDRKLFKVLFNKKPEGKIEVVEGPVTLYFRCHSPADYKYIYSLGTTEAAQLKLEQQDATMTLGVSKNYAPKPGLEGTITAENSSLLENLKRIDPKTNQSSKGIQAHEEQHAIYGIQSMFSRTSPTRTLKKATPEIEQMKDSNFIKLGLVFKLTALPLIEEFSKNEILAHFKEEVYSPEDIFQRIYLNYGPTFFMKAATQQIPAIYEYFDLKRKRHDIPPIPPDDSTEEIFNLYEKFYEKIYEEEYAPTIRAAVQAFEALKNYNHSIDKTFALLTHEPLSKWPKVVRRLLEAKNK